MVYSRLVSGGDVRFMIHFLGPSGAWRKLNAAIQFSLLIILD